MKWSKYVLGILWVVALLSYLPSIGSGFVYDFLGWQKEYSQGTFADIINCFGYNGNHQFLHLVFFSFYKIFHTQGLPWFLLFSTLHALNGYLLYKVILLFDQQWNIRIPAILAFAGALLFVLHPYSVEPVVWKVCVHYLLSLMAVLIILISFLAFLQTGERKHWWVGGIVFLISLFTLEVSFITPVVVMLCGLITWYIAENKKDVFRKAVQFGGSLWLLLGGYLILNKITLGSIVGHYGGDIHLKFDLLAIVSTEIKYLIKHLFYARFYTFKTKGVLFDQILSLPEIAFFGMSILMALAIFYLLKVKRLSGQWHLVFLGLSSSLLFVLPVANIYFYHLHIGMNDRYSYMPIAFLILAIIGLVSHIPKWISYSLIGLMLVFNIYFQQKTLRYWNQSTDVLTSLKEKFIWHDAPFVFVLNSPDNFNGIVMTSIINEPSGIEELIDYQTPRPFQGKMFDVFQFNMTTPSDGVKVEILAPMQLKVTFNQWGNWWHRNGIGGNTYENEYYKAETLEYPYLLTFKQFPEGSVIIYQDGKDWKEMKW